MNSPTNSYNGLQTTENQTREKGQRQTEKQEHLLWETCEDSRKKRDRIIYVENSSTVSQPFLIQEVGTVDELLQKICNKFPEICLHSLGMKISDSRPGTTQRRILTDSLPSEADTLYIHLYLKKHSAF